MEVAKLAIFNREGGKVGGFIIACRLFLRMKLREAMVENKYSGFSHTCREDLQMYGRRM